MAMPLRCWPKTILIAHSRWQIDSSSPNQEYWRACPSSRVCSVTGKMIQPPLISTSGPLGLRSQHGHSNDRSPHVQTLVSFRVQATSLLQKLSDELFRGLVRKCPINFSLSRVTTS